MVAAALADGSRLVRIVVLKPLANEMLRTLSQTLAGLVGRMVYHMPFSRATKLGPETPQHLMQLYEDCMQQGGVLLTLPEHLNSFRLMGNDSLSAGKTQIANDLLRVQKWLDHNCHDVMDESDELLKPAYELVYTNGQPRLLSGAPDRWTLVLDILPLVASSAAIISTSHPKDIEYEPRAPGAFPHVRVLTGKGASLLTKHMIQDIVEGKLPGLPLGHCSTRIASTVLSFFGHVDVNDENIKVLSKHFADARQLDKLYLVRGLIAFRILEFALRKRWLVNYGLDRSRCLSAVPYRAKSTPATSAEFAQPETMIVLTALSYY